MLIILFELLIACNGGNGNINKCTQKGRDSKVDGEK